MNFLNQAKGLVAKKTELEKTLDQALSNENWGASGTMLNDLAQASYNDADYRVISEAIWKTLAVQPKYWKQIFKALNLIDHLIRNGSPRIIDDTRDRIEKLRALQEFSFKEQQYERGNGIREKASLIIELLDDDSRLRFERKKAKELKQKMASRQNAVGGGAPASAGPQMRQPSRPMPRSRYDDDDYDRPRRRRFSDDEDERPRRRRADVSDDEDERPRRKPVKKASRYDDDDEEEEKPKKRVVKKAAKKAPVKKAAKKAAAVEDEDFDEDEEEEKPKKKAPVKKAAAKKAAPVEEAEEPEEEEQGETDFMDMFSAMPAQSNAAPAQQMDYGYGANMNANAYGGMVDLSTLAYDAQPQDQQQQQQQQQQAYGYGGYGYGGYGAYGYGGQQGFSGYGY
ncbi:uncharacterized protein [Blastocystis hominis]|uniref:ENTH domain-containing protein n=1 Tax=Blastocystis hominis TaxID=12968 RepID=D8LZ31_BLAHO|nr:uncharacterized protein [Blastocystis hominis]XP_012898246.1 uncharacterized protein [Blastocystis hominis]CBK21070.2 unnamed protein product [Blastocystis hominis]CBK24198.2 unnamed protein product [Blastocystis hominis]|eukprot:XP_012895118.1 uncharacterized protein [Blastocystis hominis]